VSDVSRLAIKDVLKSLVGRPHARADEVLLILASELTASDQKVGSVLSDRGAWAITEAPEPNEEILLELRRLLFAQLVVRNQCYVDEAEGFLENRLDLSLEELFCAGMPAEVVRYFHCLLPSGSRWRIYPILKASNP
jgi:hypothetical protein